MQTIQQHVDRQSHTIAAQVVYYRLYRKLTQKQLAEMCGMKQAAIARLERQPDVKWTTTTLMRIAAALDVRVSAEICGKER